MARIPEIIRRNPVTALNQVGMPAGSAFRELANFALDLQDAVRPAAIEEARIAGAKAVYRDENGKLRVNERSAWGGELAAEHNAAAYGNYLAQQRLDLRANMQNFAKEFEFDPAGFNAAMDSYMKSVAETAPPVLVPEILNVARAEGLRVSAGLEATLVERDRRASDQSTQAQFEMLADDYIALAAQGADADALATYSEIVALLDYRATMPWITFTPEQQEQTLKDLRGRAKAARLETEIEGLDHIDNLPDAQREDLRRRIADPDLSANATARLGAAARKEFVAVDARAFVGKITSDDFWTRLVQVESGGDPNAKNPRSSASGLFQITDDTFFQWAKGLEWAQGKSKADIIAMKGDPERDRQVAEVGRARNAAALEKAGVAINPGNEYLAWFFGAQGAINVLKADPSASLENVVSSGVMEANPFLSGMTVADVQRWSKRKMNVSSSEAPAMYAAVNGIENPELRGRAAAELNTWLGQKRNEESAVYQSYLTRQTEGRPASIEEVLDDERLSPSHRNSLVQSIQKESIAASNTAQTAADVMNPEFVWDTTNSKHAGRVNALFDSLYEGGNAITDEKAQGLALHIVENTGIIPKTAQRHLEGAMRSGDPAQIVGAVGLARELRARSPNVFSDLGAKGMKIEADMAEFNHYAALGYTTDEIGAAMAASRSKEVGGTASERKKQAKELSKEITVSDIEDIFDEGFFSDPSLIPHPGKQAGILSDYRDIFEREYLESGSPDAARARTDEIFKRQWGATSVFGDTRIVQFPPEAHYPHVGDGSDPISYFRDQMFVEINEAVLGEDAARRAAQDRTVIDRLFEGAIMGFDAMAGGTGGESLGLIPLQNMFIVGDEQTRREAFTPGVYPSYKVYYLHPETGAIEEHPRRFFADPTEALNKARHMIENPPRVSLGMVSGPDDEGRRIVLERN